MVSNVPKVPKAPKAPKAPKDLKDPKFIKALLQNKEVAGYESPTSKRITYNKVVNKQSFAAFTDIIESIVPLDVVNDASKNHLLPSIARVLKTSIKTPTNIYPQYLFINASPDEYMDYQDEEDQENVDDLIEYMKRHNADYVMGICIIKSEEMGMAHACAFILWSPNKASGYKFAVYDPLDHKKGNKSFDYSERAFVAERFPEHTIEFINLNQYCFKKTPEEFHCSQYIMNAEYCYIYSLYFLHKWIEYGSKLHRASLGKAIRSTYIVDPKLLTRADNKESMIYRITMMVFVCQVLLKYLKSLTKRPKQYIKNVDGNIKRIKEYIAYFNTTYGVKMDP